jgi:hypothetical protein
VHQLAGGEHAYSLEAYLAAIRSAGLRVQAVLGPWDSVINAFPHVRSERAFKGEPRRRLMRRWGLAGRIMARIPGVKKVVRWQMARDRPPGRPYTFIAIKDT